MVGGYCTQKGHSGALTFADIAGRIGRQEVLLALPGGGRPETGYPAQTVRQVGVGWR